MYFNQEVDQVLASLNTKGRGLSEQEVVKRQENDGLNKLAEQVRPSFLMVFLSQFKDFLVIILLVAAFISFLTSNAESTIVIVSVIILNAILGTIQYFKAQKSLDSLKQMSAPNAKVIRDNQRLEVLASNLVVGDIIVLEAGDIVPADARIIENYSLQVNESALTGESEAVVKNINVIDEAKVALGDQKNMLFSSSFVTYGRAKAVVTSIGMNTEIGKIASLMHATKERKTPLQISLDNFSKRLSIIIVIISIFIFGINLFRDMPILDSLMFAVSLAVAAIPEALSSIVTIALAIGTNKMTKQHAIVKNLNAVESLGCVSVICSDKTGTLTQNKMSVKDTYSLNSKDDLLEISVLCNDAYISGDKVLGDPTETGLISYYLEEASDYQNLIKLERLGEIPFDSNRKLMSVVYDFKGETSLLTKGALDVIINRLDTILDNGKIRLINDNDINNILEMNQKFSEKGLRVLAFTKRNYNNDLSLAAENNLTFIGLIAMIDPPRPESKAAVAQAQAAGILPIMITGDHQVTAVAIAKEIGIYKDGDQSLTGIELDNISDRELIELLPKVSVYARVSPEHKIRIVRLWQDLGEIVAMTGDGVNDAPALKQADIGIAMGITGTEVSKDAAAVVLTDDNFATIVSAVANGRNIYQNIKNAIKFLLSGNTAAIFTVVFATIAGLPMPFSAVHLLFINLLTDSLPAIAISMENPNSDLLKAKPRKLSESIMSRDFMEDIVIHGILIFISTIITFYIGLQVSVGVASTMAFATLALARLWHSFNCRSKQSVFKQGFRTNKYIIYSLILGITLLLLALYVPFLKTLFEISTLSLGQVGMIFALSIVPTIIIQVVRLVKEQR